MCEEFREPLKVVGNCYLCGNKLDSPQMYCLLVSCVDFYAAILWFFLEFNIRNKKTTTEWRRNRHRTQVNNTFEVSQVYFHKDSTLLPLLDDRGIPRTFSYKLIVHYVLANITCSTSAVKGTLELLTITNYKLG